MKKIYILAACLCLFTAAANAQLSYGLKAGVNIAEEHFSNTIFSSGTLAAFNGGALINYQTGLPIALQLEFAYSGEGTTEVNKTTSGSGHINEGYFNIPLLAQYKTPVGLYVETGPQIGFLLSSKETFDGTTNDIKKYYKSTDFGWCVGAGYELLSGPAKGLGLNARYVPGLSVINKEVVGGTSIKNNVFSIDLTFRLPVKK